MIKALLVLVGVIIGLVASLAVKLEAVRKNAPTCRRYSFCNAYAWPTCTDGSCKHHCTETCKCAPMGDPKHKLQGIDGGKR